MMYWGLRRGAVVMRGFGRGRTAAGQSGSSPQNWELQGAVQRRRFYGSIGRKIRIIRVITKQLEFIVT